MGFEIRPILAQFQIVFFDTLSSVARSCADFQEPEVVGFGVSVVIRLRLLLLPWTQPIIHMGRGVGSRLEICVVGSRLITTIVIRVRFTI